MQPREMRIRMPARRRYSEIEMQRRPGRHRTERKRPEMKKPERR